MFYLPRAAVNSTGRSKFVSSSDVKGDHMLPRISKVECQDASYMLFSTSDLISNTLFRTGLWDDHLLQITKFFLSSVESPLVLDIGANLGAYSIPLAKHIHDVGGKVIGFEPQRIVYYQLCGNIILNRLDNYYAINNAVGEANGEIEIPDVDYESNSNIGAFSIEKKYRELSGIENAMKRNSFKVPMLTLDSFATEKPPAFIKIDVEGHELNVLKGAVNFLNRNNFPPILFEAWSFDWFKDERAELLTFVKNLGYEVFPFGLSDYVAQHPENAIRVDFSIADDGMINVFKVR